MVQWLYFVAIARMPVGVALLLEYTAPLMVALWVRFARGEQVRSRVWLALALCLFGLALVAQVWDGLTLDRHRRPRRPRRRSGPGHVLPDGRGRPRPARPGQPDGLDLHLLGDPVGRREAVVAVPVRRCWTTTVALPGGLDGHTVTVGALSRLGGRCSAPSRAFGLVLLAVGRVGAARVGILGMIEPVGSALVAWWVLSEQLAGGAARRRGRRPGRRRAGRDGAATRRSDAPSAADCPRASSPDAG